MATEYHPDDPFLQRVATSPALARERQRQRPSFAERRRLLVEAARLTTLKYTDRNGTVREASSPAFAMSLPEPAEEWTGEVYDPFAP